MKVRKVPMRTCVVTREKCEKNQLVRVVRTPEGEVVVDTTGKMNGKGAYLKLDLSVIEKAHKTNVLGKVLEVEVPDKVYDDLKSLIK